MSPPTPQIVLASASPRRRTLLTQIGIRFIVRPADIDESVHPGESAEAYVRRMALTKAGAPIETSTSDIDLPVLGADTIVVLDGEIFGKPRDRQMALAHLDRLSGREHEVLTAVAMVSPGRTHEVVVAHASVTLRHISSREAEQYWMTGEPADKAGGYGIQGIGGIFISAISGSHGAVVGLPLVETEALLRSFGVDTWQFRGAMGDV